jgi:hypothetical protein
MLVCQTADTPCLLCWGLPDTTLISFYRLRSIPRNVSGETM